MSDQKVYLVTGASRGIGLALVTTLASKHPTAFIYAGARDPSSATSLNQLAALHPSRIQVIKYLSASEENNKAVAQLIKDKHGHLDCAIANAGMGDHWESVMNTPPQVMLDFYKTNVTGSLILFQSLQSLLKSSTQSPRFVPVSSALASLTNFSDVPMGVTAYACSKVALNYLAKRIHVENDWLVCFPVAPGMVDTDMGRGSAELDKTGTAKALLDVHQISPEQSATQLVNTIDGATREKDGGQFVNLDGDKFPW
ncbi:hypothetical protein AX17_007509 [Amanita inopinata Kibby_2008]|nr:hypothetical protein AX17_007509 [Amanita inopinata Kibby_2008]